VSLKEETFKEPMGLSRDTVLFQHNMNTALNDASWRVLCMACWSLLMLDMILKGLVI